MGLRDVVPYQCREIRDKALGGPALPAPRNPATVALLRSSIKMVKYLGVADDSTGLSTVTRIIQRAKTAGDASGCWQYIFATFLKAVDVFLCYHDTSLRSTTSGRKLSAVTHCTDTSLKKREAGDDNREDLFSSRVVIVELADVDESQMSRDASQSAVYRILSRTDTQHPGRSSLDALAAGEKFILFEVAGG